MPSSNKDREYFNFADNGDGTTSRFVIVKSGGSGGGNSSSIESALSVAMLGSLPSPNFDAVSKVIIDTNTIDFVFYCNGVRQFEIKFTNVLSDMNTNIIKVSDLILEDLSGSLLLESGDTMVVE